MRKIYIIGTIHSGYTPDEELREVLEELDPDQVLVELPSESFEELEEGEVYPSEMVFAHNWAQENKLKVGAFDVLSEHSYFNEGKTPEDPEYRELLDHQDSIIKKYSWKDFNIQEYNDLLVHPAEEVLFSTSQARKREEEMAENIKNMMIEDGVIVIITGTAHLQYFEEQFPSAILPLRNRE